MTYQLNIMICLVTKDIKKQYGMRKKYCHAVPSFVIKKVMRVIISVIHYRVMKKYGRYVVIKHKIIEIVYSH